MLVQLLPSPAMPAMPALPGTHYSWVGWSNVRKFLAQGNQPLVLPHIPQLYSWVDWSNVGKVLVQGNNNNKQHHLGIEPRSSGSQADPKPLHAAVGSSMYNDGNHSMYNDGVFCIM